MPRKIKRSNFKRRTIKRKTTKHDIHKFANMLRRRMTRSERLLWSKLKINTWGVQFEPQYVLHGYIPDFYCISLKLCIEVDGKIHNVKRVQRHDKKRESILLSYGNTVIRFTNEEVNNNISYVLSVIRKYVIS